MDACHYRQRLLVVVMVVVVVVGSSRCAVLKLRWCLTYLDERRLAFLCAGYAGGAV